MQFYCISDNIDTKIGMRLVGIKGKVVHEVDEFKEAIEEICKNDNIGILLITEKLIKLAPSYISNLKLYRKKPLIVEIPDRHGSSHITENISKYIKDAIGIKI